MRCDVEYQTRRCFHPGRQPEHLGAIGLNTAQTLQIAPVMDRIGLQAIDFTSSTHMGVCVRTHKQDPWALICGMRSEAPHTPLQFITTGYCFISWGNVCTPSSCGWRIARW